MLTCSAQIVEDLACKASHIGYVELKLLGSGICGVILKVSEEDGETYLEPIEDDNEFNEIGKIFEERLTEMFDFADEE